MSEECRLAKYIKLIYRSVFLLVFAYVNVSHLNVNKELETFLYSHIIGKVIKSKDNLAGHIAYGGKLVHYIYI